MAEELKSCPFCGAAAFTNEFMSRHPAAPTKARWRWEVVCRGENEHSLGSEDTEAEAAAAWNQRAPHPR